MHATTEPNAAAEVGAPGFSCFAHGTQSKESAEEKCRKMKTGQTHHGGFALSEGLAEGAGRRLVALGGARTLEDFARFTVQPTGQLSGWLIENETCSILTAYATPGIGFSLKRVTAFSRSDRVW
jgi:hypothetical protein